MTASQLTGGVCEASRSFNNSHSNHSHPTSVNLYNYGQPALNPFTSLPSLSLATHYPPPASSFQPSPHSSSSPSNHTQNSEAMRCSPDQHFDAFAAPDLAARVTHRQNYLENNNNFFNSSPLITHDANQFYHPTHLQYAGLQYYPSQYNNFHTPSAAASGAAISAQDLYAGGYSYYRPPNPPLLPPAAFSTTTNFQNTRTADLSPSQDPAAATATMARAAGHQFQPPQFQDNTSFFPSPCPGPPVQIPVTTDDALPRGSSAARRYYALLDDDPCSKYIKRSVSENFCTTSDTYCASIKTDMDTLCDIYMLLNYRLRNHTAINYLNASLSINGTALVCLPLALLDQLNQYENNENRGCSEHIRFPLELVCGELNLSALRSEGETKIQVAITFVNLQDTTDRNRFPDIFYSGEIVVIGKYSRLLPVTPASALRESSPRNIQVFPAMYIKFNIDSDYDYGYANNQENNNIQSPRPPRTQTIDFDGPGEYGNITPPYLIFTNEQDTDPRDMRVVTIPLRFRGICKGFVLLCENLFDISSVEVKLNGISITKIRKERMSFLCQRLTNRMLYVPLDISHKFFDNKIESYDSVIPFDCNSTQASIVLCARNLRFLTIVACCLSTFHLKNNKIVIDEEISARATSYLYELEKGRYRGTRPIDAERAFCVIAQENINLGENYATCHLCKNSFVNRYLHMYFASNHRNTCPSCRGPWDDDLEFYCNQDHNTFSQQPFSMTEI